MREPDRYDRGYAVFDCTVPVEVNTDNPSTPIGFDWTWLSLSEAKAQRDALAAAIEWHERRQADSEGGAC